MGSAVASDDSAASHGAPAEAGTDAAVVAAKAAAAEAAKEAKAYEEAKVTEKKLKGQLKSAEAVAEAAKKEHDYYDDDDEQARADKVSDEQVAGLWRAYEAAVVEVQEATKALVDHKETSKKRKAMEA